MIRAASEIDRDVYLRNIVFMLNMDGYTFDVISNIGWRWHERWTLMPQPEGVGGRPITEAVCDEQSRVITRLIGRAGIRCAARPIVARTCSIGPKKGAHINNGTRPTDAGRRQVGDAVDGWIMSTVC